MLKPGAKTKGSDGHKSFNCIVARCNCKFIEFRCRILIPSIISCNGFGSNSHHVKNKDIQLNQYYLTLSVDYFSASLWHPPYSEYQQYLFDTIDKMHKAGNSYIKIAQWMNDNNHLTPRGSVFKPNHAWSIHMKMLIWLLLHFQKSILCLLYLMAVF
jgi:hypothetical protein